MTEISFFLFRFTSIFYADNNNNNDQWTHSFCLIKKKIGMFISSIYCLFYFMFIIKDWPPGQFLPINGISVDVSKTKK